MQQTADSFGRTLRRGRKKYGYSQELIAERAGISQRYLAAIENDKRRPSLKVLVKVVNSIGASFDEILGTSYIEVSETAVRISRLISQCGQRDQELVLTLVDQMLNKKEHQEKSK